MAALTRRRKRTVKLNHRLGSRRTRMLLALAFSFIALASWQYSSNQVDQHQDFLVAIMDLPSGATLGEANTSVIHLDLAESANKYLQPGSKSLGQSITRPVRAGELITKSSVADFGTASCTSVPLSLETQLPAELHVGDLTDIWAAPANTAVNSVPNQIVQQAELQKISKFDDALSRSQIAIELCVSTAEIRSVVNAIAQKFVLVVVKSK